jgi:spermidine synthase
MKLPLATVGFTSTIAQIVLMRELVATFYGNELLFGLILAAWLAWVAVGSWGLARLAVRPRLGRGAFAVGLVLAGILLPVQITLVRNARTLLGVTPGAFVEFIPMVGAVVLILAPLCVLAGFLFTLGARLMVEAGQTAGQAYVWEGVGAVVGGALFSFLLIRWLDPYQTALLVTTVNLTGAILLYVRLLDASLVTLITLLICSFFGGRALHEATLRWQWPDLAFAADSPYGRLIIQARESQRAFFENGLLAFETQGTFPEEVAHFPLLTHPDPSQVLLIGGGVAGDLREILKHPIASVTYVELDPLLIEAAQTHLSPRDAAVLNDPRVKLIFSDGRLYVKQVSDTRRISNLPISQSPNPPISHFDVIILDLPEPSTGALNRFYTQEFFTEIRAILNPGGIFSLGLPSAENYWSPELARRNGSIYHTLKTVFPEIVVLPGEHNFFLASDTPLETSPAILAERLVQRNIGARWVTPEYINYVFTTDRFAGVQQELSATTGVRLNRDLTPISYYYNLALWFSRFYPNLRSVFERTSLVNLWWVAMPLVIVVVLTRWQRGCAVPVVIAGIGLAQMTLELVILFAFQVLHGYVYAEVSLIVTTFMAGLAVGGAVSNQVVQLSDSSPPRLVRIAYCVLRIPSVLRTTQYEIRKWMLIAVQVAIIIYSGLLPLILRMSIPAPALVFPLLALLAGLLTGMAFPLAVALVQGNAGRVAGMLYGADLAGGCLGALLGVVLFIPVLGIPQTCVVIALVGLAGLLALV